MNPMQPLRHESHRKADLASIFIFSCRYHLLSITILSVWWFICQSVCTWILVHTWMLHLFSFCWSACQPESRSYRQTDCKTVNTCKSLNKPASQWLLIVSRPISQSVSQSVSLSASQSVSLSVSLSVNLSVCQSVSQSACQSISQSVRQTDGQTDRLSITEAVKLISYRVLLFSCVFQTVGCGWWTEPERVPTASIQTSRKKNSLSSVWCLHREVRFLVLCCGGIFPCHLIHHLQWKLRCDTPEFLTVKLFYSIFYHTFEMAVLLKEETLLSLSPAARLFDLGGNKKFLFFYFIPLFATIFLEY